MNKESRVLTLCRYPDGLVDVADSELPLREVLQGLSISISKGETRKCRLTLEILTPIQILENALSIHYFDDRQAVTAYQAAMKEYLKAYQEHNNNDT